MAEHIAALPVDNSEAAAAACFLSRVPVCLSDVVDDFALTNHRAVLVLGLMLAVDRSLSSFERRQLEVRLHSRCRISLQLEAVDVRFDRAYMFV